MARPKSDAKREAILAAATRVVVAQGLAAPTAVIAREAGVSNGSLFTYFATKAELFDQLYRELKRDMASATVAGLTSELPARDQFAHMWRNWTGWAVANPGKRRALALLQLSGEVSADARAAGQGEMLVFGTLLDRARASGPCKDVPMVFVAAMVTAMAETTLDFVLADPTHADAHAESGFEAIWRMLGT